MKYIITDKNEAKIGEPFTFHSTLARDCEGEVIRAGHCEKIEDGSYRVWGESIGYSIPSQPEDAKLLQELLK
jgi:hypothetical protein